LESPGSFGTWKGGNGVRTAERESWEGREGRQAVTLPPQRMKKARKRRTNCSFVTGLKVITFEMYSANNGYNTSFS